MIEWATDSTGVSDRARLDFAPEIPVGLGLSGARGLVLVATSGSRASRNATVVAADLARAWGASLRIVQVVAPVQYRVGRLAPMRAVPRQLLDPFVSPVLTGARELAWRRGVAATLALVAGEPAPTIAAAAAATHADVLVIGARSADRTRRRTAPTCRWLEAHAPCPTLTAHSVSQPRHSAQRRRRAGSASRFVHQVGPSGLVSGAAEESG